MKSDASILHEAENKLRQAPELSDARVGVLAHAGVVALTGEVGNVLGKTSAKDAAASVEGVRAVANEVQIMIRPAGQPTDSDIAEAAADALRRNLWTSFANIMPSVDRGRVRLSGEVVANASNVEITIADDVVTLSGCVLSRDGHDRATRAALSVPGVGQVENQLRTLA